jgi:predicted acetyltransferase
MTIRSPASAADLDAIADLLRHCYAGAPERTAVYLRRIGAEQLRLMGSPDRIEGCVALLPKGQFFGGRAVPGEGWAAVGVPLEARGDGQARRMLEAVLIEERARGVALVPLYASTQALYRRLGFETAGAANLYRMNPADLRPGDRDLPATRIDPLDTARLAPLYQGAAAAHPGWLDRGPAHWGRLTLTAPDEVLYAYLLGDPAAPEGYLLYSMKAEGDRFAISVRDRVTLSPAAHRRLWSLLADSRSMVRVLRWTGPGQDADTLCVPEQSWQIESAERWMLRLVNLPLALTARGYPAAARGALTLTVTDPLFPENTGPWRLTVEGGQGRVEEARGAEDGAGLRLSIGALAPLYSGLFSASALQARGAIEGPTAAVAMADTLFAGPEPWMPDRF